MLRHCLSLNWPTRHRSVSQPSTATIMFFDILLFLIVARQAHFSVQLVVVCRKPYLWVNSSRIIVTLSIPLIIRPAAWLCFGALQQVGNSTWSWRFPSLVQCAIPIGQVALIYFIPESPRWLVAQGRVRHSILPLPFQPTSGSAVNTSILKPLLLGYRRKKRLVSFASTTQMGAMNTIHSSCLRWRRSDMQ